MKVKKKRGKEIKEKQGSWCLERVIFRYSAMDSLGDGARLRRPIRTLKASSEPSSSSFEDVDLPLEPLTPAARVFCSPSLNTSIFVTMGFKTPCNLETLKDGISCTLLKHKRFSSVLKRDDKGIIYWAPTNVHLDDHIKVVSPQDADVTSPTFVLDYVADLMQVPLDMSKPLFEFHILKAKLGDATENLVMRVHHSMGDGVSLMSLLLACTRRVDRPNTMPTLPTLSKKKNWNNDQRCFWRLFSLLWRFLLILWYSLCDMCAFAATCLGLKDSQTCIMGYHGIEKSPRSFVYTTIPLSDIRTVKQTTNGTINDVVYGMLVAALSRYIREKYGKIQVTSTPKESHGHISEFELVLYSIHGHPQGYMPFQEIQNMMHEGSQARWGNDIGYVLLPVPLSSSQNPLQYVYEAKRIFNQKKLSFGPIFSYRTGSLLMKITGVEMPTKLTYRCVANTTLSFSNVVGPVEEIEFFGHPITHILPTSAGYPQALCVHCLSYMGNVSIMLSTAKDIIPDPQKICEYMTDALKDMKTRSAVS